MNYQDELSLFIQIQVEMYVCPCSVAPINVCHTFILKGKESLFWTLKVKKKKREKSRQAQQGRGKIQEEITSFLD